MSFTPNGIYFEELSDSPKIHLGQELVSATRVFLVNWSDWQAMCYELIGIWRILGDAPLFIPPISFPGVPLMVVSDVQVEPFDGHSPQSQTVDIGALTNTYQKAKITAQYKTLNYGSDRPDQPAHPEGTILTYSGETGAEVIRLPNRTFYWGGTYGPTQRPVGEDADIGLIVPTGEFTLTWKRVLSPPWDTIKKTRGKLNTASFVSNDIGTVLFLGSRENRTYQFGQQENQGQLWDLEYKFAVKSNTLTDGTTVVGWNYFYKDTGPLNGEVWVPVVDNENNPPYQSADFDALFTFGTITAA